MLSRKTTSVLILLALVAVVVGVYAPFAPAGRRMDAPGPIATSEMQGKAESTGGPKVPLPDRELPGATPSSDEDVPSAAFLKTANAKDELQLTKYPTGDMSAQTMHQVLRTTVLGAQCMIGRDDKTLLVLATPAEHEKVLNVMKSLRKKPVDVEEMNNVPRDSSLEDEEEPADGPIVGLVRETFGRGGGVRKEQLQVTKYTTGDMSAQTIMRVLPTVVPAAAFMAGEDNKTLIVIATPAEHGKICHGLRSLRKDPVAIVASSAQEASPAAVGARKHGHTALSAENTPQSARPFGIAHRNAPALTSESSYQATRRTLPGQVGVPTRSYASSSRGAKWYAYEPSDPEMAKLEEADAKKGQEVAEMVKAYRTASGEKQQAEVRSKLKKAVDEHFAVRQSKRELEVSRLEARLEKIRQSIGKRNEAREQIVDRHVAKLLGETDDLEF